MGITRMTTVAGRPIIITAASSGLAFPTRLRPVAVEVAAAPLSWTNIAMATPAVGLIRLTMVAMGSETRFAAAEDQWKVALHWSQTCWQP